MEGFSQDEFCFKLSNDIECMMITKTCDREKENQSYDFWPNWSEVISRNVNFIYFDQ